MDRAKPIIEAVRREGDAALRRFAHEFDHAPADVSLRVTEAEFDAAAKAVSAEVRAALEFAIDNIRRFHEAQKPEDMWLKEIRPGVFAATASCRSSSIACYVPRGKGSFPSVFMMTTIPGMVAGVARLIISLPRDPMARWMRRRWWRRG